MIYKQMIQLLRKTIKRHVHSEKKFFSVCTIFLLFGKAFDSSVYIYFLIDGEHNVVVLFVFIFMHIFALQHIN